MENNEYDSLVSELDQNDQSQIKQAMFTNNDIQPDAKAEAVKYSEQYKVPVGFAEQNLDSFRKKSSELNNDVYEDLAKNYPNTGDYLKDTVNAGVAKDDLDSLKGIETVVKDRDSGSHLGKAFEAGLSDLNNAILQTPALAYDVAAWPVNKILEQANSDYRIKSSDIGFLKSGFGAGDYYKHGSETLKKDIPELNEDILKEAVAGNYSKAGKSLAAQIATNAPQQLFLLASAFYGNPSAGLAFSGLTSATQSNQQANEQGLDPAQALPGTIAKAGIEVAAESLGTLRVIEQWGGSLAKTIGKEGYKEVMKSVGKTIAASVITEGTEEAVTSMAQDFVDYATGENPQAFQGMLSRAVNAGIVGGASGGFMTGPTALGVGMRKSIEVNQANQDKQMYLDLGAGVEKSKLYQRLPGKMQEFVDQNVKGTPVENLYISAQSFKEYFQSKNLSPIEEAQKLGVQKEFESASETGGDVVLPMGKWVAGVVGTEHYTGLQDEVRFAADGLSVKEAKESQKTLNEELKKQNELVQQADKEGREIVDDVYNQLVESGVPKNQAKHQAVIYRAFNVLAQREGVSPQGLYDQYGLKILKTNAPSVEQTDLPFLAQDLPLISLQKNESGQYDYDADVLNMLKNSIAQADAGQRIVKPDGSVVASASTFPDFFKDKGYTKKGVLKILNDYQAGKILTEKQTDILNDLYEGAVDKVNRREYFQDGNIETKYSQEDESISLKTEDVRASGVFDSRDSIESISDFLNPDGVYKKEINLNKNGLDQFERPFFLDHIEVNENSRKSGIGKNALKSIEESAQLHGADVFLLNASPVGSISKSAELPGLIKFYEKQGYKVLRKSKENAEMFKPIHPKEYFQSKDPGLKFAAVKTDNRLTVRPMDNVKASAEIIDSPAGKTAVVDNFQATSKYQGVAADALKSLERAAWRNGAETMTISQNRIRKSKSAFFDSSFYKQAGFTETKTDYDTLYTKKLDRQLSYNQEAQGSFTPNANVIKLFQSANESTFLHESAHFFLEVMGDLAQKENASDGIKKDYAEVLKWMGVNSREEIETKHHEQWARGFESYLMTGKSPSHALRKAFNTFKVWLTRIYKQASSLNVQLNPEITGVMDRLLASEDEINAAEQGVNLTNLLKDPIAAGMNDKQAAAYKEAIEEARVYAEAKLNKKLIDELNRKQSKIYKEKYQQYYGEFLKELLDRPIFKAMQVLKTGQGFFGDGDPIKIDKQSVVERMGQEIADLLPKNIFAKDGLDYGMVAEMFGYENPESFISEMAETPKVEEVARQQANEKIKIEYPELYKDPSIKEEAQMALHNEKRSLKLKYELEYLESKYKTLLKDATKRIVARSPVDQQVREQAKKIVGSIMTKDLKPHLYLRAESKAAREAGQKLAAGDIKGAFEAKRVEYLNHELYRSVVEAKESVDKSVKDFKKIFKSTEDVAKGRDVDLVNTARAILAKFGIVQGRDEDPFIYLKKVKEYDPAQYANLEGILNDALDGAKNYESVSYDDFVEMKDVVDALWDLSKSTKELEIDGKTFLLEQAVTELNEQTQKHLGNEVPKSIKQDLSDIEKFKVKLLGAKASLTRAESWTDLMDLGQKGPFKKFIWNPISESITRYRLEKDGVLKNFRAITEEYKDVFKGKAIVAPELDGFVFKNKANLIMAILHTGNESNKSKLLRGRGWGTVNEDGTLNSSQFDSMISRMQKDGTLTQRDYEFAQKIWDLMETLKPGAQKAHKKMYGYYFNEITANEIETPWGNYRGGYIPAKVDAYTNEDAAIREERNDLENNNNSFQFPTTGRGFTKKRVDSYAAPLSLEANLLASHIDGVLRFTHIEPFTKQVARLITNKQFRNKLFELDPQIAREMLNPWLQRSAQQKVVIPSDDGIGKAMDGVAKYLRTSVAMQFMVGNVVNAAQQLTGVVVAATKVDPKYLMASLYRYTTDRKNVLSSIYEKSDWMKANQDSNVFETQQAIEKIVVDPTVFESVQNFAKAHTYFLQSATQNIVNTVVWQGAYDQAVANKQDEKEAVRSADEAVRLSQGTVNAEDISKFETGAAVKRLFTQFAGYFNMIANLQNTELTKISRTVGLKKGASKAFYMYMMGFMIPAVLSEALIVAARGKGLDEDDDGYIDDIMSLFFGSQFKTATAMVPFVGPAINTAYNNFNGKSFDDKLSFSPVLSVLESGLTVPAKIYKGYSKQEIKKQTVKDSLMLLGMLSSLPTGPVGKPLGYIMDNKSGDATPSGPIDYARGLVTGQRGK